MKSKHPKHQAPAVDESDSPPMESFHQGSITAGEAFCEQTERIAQAKEARPSEGPEGLSSTDYKRTIQELQVHQVELRLQNEELCRIHAELDLTRSRYFDLYNLAPVGYCTINAKSLIVEANLTLANLLGLTRSALVGKPLTHFIVPEDQDIYYLQRKQLLDSGEPQVFDLHMRKKEHGTIWARLNATCVHDEGCAPECRIILSDVTTQKQAEEEIRRNESRSRRLVAILQHPSTTIHDFLDFALEQAIELTASSIGYIYHFHEDRQQFVLNAWSKNVLPACSVTAPQTCYALAETGFWGEAVRQGRAFINNDFQASHPLKKGYPKGHVPLKKFMTVPIFRGESIVSVVGLANKESDYEQTDILQVSLLMETVWKVAENIRAEEDNAKLEAQLQQAQKMESVGLLAGGVAHDFNNMLGVILGHAELAMEQIDPRLPVFEDLQEIQLAAERSAEITRQLLTFARKQAVVPRVVDLNDTVAGMLKMLRRLIGEDINLSWQPGIDLWPLKIDPAQIDQILANLCVNARDAITGVGKIIIETDNRSLDRDYCHAHPGFFFGEYVRIAISDNGCGMDPETQCHIFEPFFTTKAVGQGTGLGLATMYGAVKQNKGFINVYSEPGQGTTFSIYLPRHVEKSTEVMIARMPDPTESGDELILLVEDELTLLQMTTVMLKRQGYGVLAADSPAAAIRLAGQHIGTIDLLMTDVVMPEMNGRELAEQLITDRPKMKCLFMSGYTANIVASKGVLGNGMYFIQKPFSTKELAAKVRVALQGGES